MNLAPPGVTINDESTPAEPESTPETPEDGLAVDFNQLVNGLLTFEDGVHTCNLCGKKSPWRTTMVRHVEANHVENAGHICDVCGSVAKTRHAFNMHMRRKHPTAEQMKKKDEATAATPTAKIEGATTNIVVQEITMEGGVPVMQDGVPVMHEGVSMMQEGVPVMQVDVPVTQEEGSASLASQRQKRKNAGKNTMITLDM